MYRKKKGYLGHKHRHVLLYKSSNFDDLQWVGFLIMPLLKPHTHNYCLCTDTSGEHFVFPLPIHNYIDLLIASM